jgi:hypothetical protein
VDEKAYEVGLGKDLNISWRLLSFPKGYGIVETLYSMMMSPGGKGCCEKIREEKELRSFRARAFPG